MRLKNTTEIDNEVIRKVIRFTCPPGVHGFDVRVSNHSGITCAGRAYAKGSGYHDRACPFVVCRVGIGPFPCFIYPYQYAQHKGKKYVISDRVEMLVYIMSHELRHLWQAIGTASHPAYGKTRRRGMAWGSRGRFSEVDTEAYAIKMLRAWREAKP